ncbi:MAG TPA: segregation/condensation protein A [Anaerolineae bacterium]|nr:segregation/condensation protein A [Anaerolineae bacterium]HQH38141.1 segregation/condensation protein A [Anaerolineae bacterium]
MSYEISTPIFEGPLELLLHLIEKNELDITKIALAKVTDEFLSRVNELRAKMQIEVVADFLAVAARLLWIKSRVLLPQPPESARLARDEEDVGDELVRQLRAYRQYKEAAQWLRERDEAGLRAYVHIGAPPRPQHFTIDLSGVTLEDLRTAAQAVLFPAEGPPPQDAIQRPRISIVQQICLIRQRLIYQAESSSGVEAVTYRTLLSQRPTRVEAVVTLQAILELIKQCAVQARQAQPFKDIIIEALVPPEQIPEPTTPAEEAR